MGGRAGMGACSPEAFFLDQLVIGTLAERAWPGRREPRRWIPQDGMETEGSAPKKRRAAAARSDSPLGCVVQCFLYPGITTDE